MAGAVQDVEAQFADLDLIALIEPAVGAEIAHAGHAEAFTEETTLSSRYLSAMCGPSIFDQPSVSRNSAAPPT